MQKTKIRKQNLNRLSITGPENTPIKQESAMGLGAKRRAIGNVTARYGLRMRMQMLAKGKWRTSIQSAAFRLESRRTCEECGSWMKEKAIDLDFTARCWITSDGEGVVKNLKAWGQCVHGSQSWCGYIWRIDTAAMWCLQGKSPLAPQPSDVIDSDYSCHVLVPLNGW